MWKYRSPATIEWGSHIHIEFWIGALKVLNLMNFLYLEQGILSLLRPNIGDPIKYDQHDERSRFIHVGLNMTKKFLRYRFEISHTIFFHKEAGHLSETSISDNYNIQLPYKPNDQT